LNGILKTEFGFEGFVVSDWDGQYTGVASANAGLDLVMPDAGFWGGNLTTAVRNGSVSETRLNDMVARQLAAFYLLGQDRTYPPPSIYSSTQKHLAVNVQGNHKSLIAEIGAAGTVLVKNINNALPLRNPEFLNIYGYDAQTSPSPWSNPSRYGGGYEVNFGWKTFNGTLVTGGGSGGSTPPYVISPFQAIQERITSQDPPGILRWDFYSENPNPAYVNADACLVFINAYASESFDRVTLTDGFSDDLVNNVAANCSNTVAVLHSTGIRSVEAWIDNPNVTAVLFAGVPGQESGHSLTSVLWGDVSPSGRLPYTVAKNQSDYGSFEAVNGSVSLDAFPQSNFTEGLFIDYRHFDSEKIEPRFEFGFGLSYSNFSYGTINVANLGGNLDQYPASSVVVVQGGHPWLWEVLYNVSIDVANTGAMDAHEVPQLYVTVPEPGTPARQLRGFERVLLKPGETKTVSLPLTRRDLSVWDVVAQQWKLNRGGYELMVGSSSRDLRANATIQIA
jgi:beta-glucosidase